MTTQKQLRAAKENIKKAQKKWQEMSHRQRSLRQPSGRSRAKPGRKGEGDYYRIEVRDKNQFSSFRTHDVGSEGHTQRIAGRRKSGSWDTVTWLISKADAKKERNTLVTDRKKTQKVLNQLGSKPKHVKGDVFEAKPRPNVPEKDKPTKAQQKARKENIKKAHKAKRE